MSRDVNKLIEALAGCDVWGVGIRGDVLPSWRKVKWGGRSVHPFTAREFIARMRVGDRIVLTEEQNAKLHSTIWRASADCGYVITTETWEVDGVRYKAKVRIK